MIPQADVQTKIGAPTPTVFAVIPVFNRLHFTLECIRRLKSQTYQNLVIIVSDGGSTDDTPQVVSSTFPDVVVLTSERELWWAGSTKLGVGYALAKSINDADFVLMLNNDTEIPESYVETLVAASQAHGAAVGALIVDSRDPTRVLDAGEYVSWQNYDFPLKTSITSGECYCDDVDVLPGRGSLVPLRMIRVAGNIDADCFPHYLADYEFFYRIKSCGFPLGVCYETRVSAHIEETGIVPGLGKGGFRRVWDELFSRRSMGNVVDHWRFITRHAPKADRLRLQLRLILRTLAHLGLRTPLRPVALPIYWLILLPNVIEGQIRAFRHFKLARARQGRDVWCYPSVIPGLIRGSAYLLLSPGPVHADDCARYGANPGNLIQQGVLKALAVDGWFAFATFQVPQGPATALLGDALSIGAKVRRTLAVRKALRSAHVSVSVD